MREKHGIFILFPLMPDAGRGIVAHHDIQARTIIDISPVLVMPFEELDAITPTRISHYTW